MRHALLMDLVLALGVVSLVCLLGAYAHAPGILRAWRSGHFGPTAAALTFPSSISAGACLALATRQTEGVNAALEGVGYLLLGVAAIVNLGIAVALARHATAPGAGRVGDGRSPAQ